MGYCPHTHDFGCPFCHQYAGTDLCATGDEVDCECDPEDDDYVSWEEASP